MPGPISFDVRSLSARLILGMITVVVVALLATAIMLLLLVQNDLDHTVLLTETLVWEVLGVAVLVAIIPAVLIGYVIAHRIAAPLHDLSSASESMGRGDLSTPVHSLDSVTEIAALAGTLERMRRRLRDAHGDLAQAKEWSENLIASLAEGVFTLDKAGRITSFSPGAERILGWRATDIIGRSFESIFSTSVQNATPGTVIRAAVKTRQGQPVVLLISGGAVARHPDGALDQVFVLRDVTQEEEAMRMREFFLANVSHELKTPLSSLRASVEMLGSELSNLSREEQQELINSFWLGTIRLEELVDNLLSSASIRSGHFQVNARPMELAAVLREIAITTKPLLSLQGQQLQLDLPPAVPLVWADPRRLNQVLVNLISNASKYGPPHAPITVCVQPQSERVMVSIIDRGEPIAPENHATMFQPFQTGGEVASGGVGLGLSIVQTIVERQGGEAGIKRAPDGGNAFWFTLRIATETETERS